MPAAGMSRQRYLAFLTRLPSKRSDISITHLMRTCVLFDMRQATLLEICVRVCICVFHGLPNRVALVVSVISP